ncbi:MAG: aminotransferase class III-fold pyridoxal phosphate-dependent enzyme [Bacteroidia bacterium]|jgi:acetylornithine aminotransferase
MKTFEVYPRFAIEPVKAFGSSIWDKQGTRYLDLYGGHAVISIGHTHPHYVRRIEEQLHKIGFYSNSVEIPMQDQLSKKLGELSGYASYHLFLCNSGAEANENALKLASFRNKRKKIIAFLKSFHGRTSLAVATTDDPKIRAVINEGTEVLFLPLNDEVTLEQNLNEEICAVIVEGIQGVGGVHLPSHTFLRRIREGCNNTGAVMIVDEIQSGYGRSGKFFAHQHADVTPDLITVAKGMGNGFPIAGVLIAPEFEAKQGSLGTTFGGSHLACAAALAVLEVIEAEDLISRASYSGKYLMDALSAIQGVKEVRGLGLMIGIELDAPIAPIRNRLLYEDHIFTGSSSDPNTLRVLPALNLSMEEADHFIQCFKKQLQK